jgi:hypothetical protein
MKPEKSTHFRLEKLYLDCIDDSGNCFIIYWAKLKLFFIKVTYSGLIFSDPKGVTFEVSSLKRMRDPLINDLLLFYSQILKIRGSWKRTDDPLPMFTFKDAMNHEMTWNCHHPRALTEIDYDENTYNGFGYAETLSLTIKPWNLPVEELKWGRFLCDNYSIIWINWEGNYPVNKVFCNGDEYNDVIFGADNITFGSGVYILDFKEISVVRKGKLSDTLSKMLWLKVIIGSRIFNTLEIKYKAKSILNRNSEIIATGWSIFEIVTWGK